MSSDAASFDKEGEVSFNKGRKRVRPTHMKTKRKCGTSSGYFALIEKLTTDSVQKNKKKARQTVEQNVSRVANIHFWMTGETWDGVDFAWLMDTGGVVKFIESRCEWKSKKTQGNQVCAIAAVLRHLKEDEKLGGVYKFYSEHTTKLSKDVMDTLKDNGVTMNNFLSWDAVMQLKPVKLVERLLYALYTDIPPRRAEYKTMVYVTEKMNMDDPDQNYLVSRSGTCVEIVLNDYKERPKNRYGAVTIPLTENLSTLFDLFLLERGVSDGARVFTDYTFSGPLVRAFKMGVNGIRHSFVSWFLDGTRTLREKEEMAKSMGTSVGTLECSYFQLHLTKKRRCERCRACPSCGPVSSKCMQSVTEPDTDVGTIVDLSADILNDEDDEDQNDSSASE